VRARFPSARILTYGYNTDVLGLWSNAGRDVLREHGMGLAYAISNSQPNEAKRPIFFVAHSLGGLITELALLICLERSEPHLQSIAFCAAGIVFMGTPHSGSSLTNWGYTVAKLLDRIWRIDKKLRSALKQRSDVLIGVEELFQAQLTADGALKHVKIFCFYETVPVDAVGYVVPRESATMSPHPSHGIDANHMDMAKFTGSDDAGFISLRSVLHEWSSRAEEMLIDDQERIVQIHKFL
jgi:pimeloyl-ACP methyl ester carboxylesterase